LHPFPAPHLSADFHDLAGAADRGIERDAVKALHHQRPGRADPEPESAVGDEIQARRGHRQQRRGADVDGKHPRGQFDGVGLGSQIPELADGVEGVRLGHHGDVDAGLLEFNDAVDGLVKAGRIIQRDPDSHQRQIPRRWKCAAAGGRAAVVPGHPGPITWAAVTHQPQQKVRKSVGFAQDSLSAAERAASIRLLPLRFGAR
jgi:hypothetical protein